MAKNPPWQRDELILALDLYMRHNLSHMSQNHPEVIKLSQILNALPIYQDRPDGERYRNPNGVYMKLCNFLRFDPNYHGTGLQRGGKLEEEIWNEFAADPTTLYAIAQSIIYGVKTPINDVKQDKEEDEFPEGKVLYRLHKTRERNRKLVELVKEKAIKTGNGPICTVCGFDFFAIYGEIGKGYIECHHTIPVSQYSNVKNTKISDLALVCSNCHRMLHKRRPWLTINELSEILHNH